MLSTGHSAIALFAILGEVGLYNQDELHTYGQPGSRIEESPLEGTPGFEITGGSLGQGLSQAVGMALGERLRGSGARSTACCRTASWRRARSGRRPCRPATSGSAT